MCIFSNDDKDLGDIVCSIKDYIKKAGVSVSVTPRSTLTSQQADIVWTLEAVGKTRWVPVRNWVILVLRGKKLDETGKDQMLLDKWCWS